MIICAKCNEYFEREYIEAAEVALQDGQTRSLDLCKTCAAIWDETAPGAWVILGNQEVRRMWWPCDSCGDVCRYDAVKLMVRPMQQPPRIEFIVCEDCENRDPSRWCVPGEAGP